MNRIHVGFMLLETGGLVSFLSEGLLAASPMADIVADPYAYSAPEKSAPILFTFSDIPDALFREPRALFEMSPFRGGSKS